MKRFNEEIKHYAHISSAQANGKIIISKKYANNFTLKFKINVSEYNNKIEPVGSFIRTAVRMLTNIDPNNILFILDYSKCDIRYVDQLISKLISNSTTSVIFTNTLIILKQSDYNNIPQTSYQNCVDILDNEIIYTALNNYEPFPVKSYNGLLEKNLFKYFNSNKQYILLECNNSNFSIIYSPLIFELASYTIEDLQMDGIEEKEKSLASINDIDPESDRTYIVCIEKIPNIYRHGEHVNN